MNRIDREEVSFELDLQVVKVWTGSLCCWGLMLSTGEEAVIVNPLADATMYCEGIERAIAVLEETFARLDRRNTREGAGP